MKLKYKIYRYIAFYMALTIIFEVVSPSVAMALTYGPYQPEYASFEPASTTDMVDLFTGDFKYNLPLMDVDGYPVNLSYHAGAAMDEEASWVGLGWTLNAGSMNRSVRGVPDDFKGESIETVTNVRPQKSWGVGAEMTMNSNGTISYVATGLTHGTYLQGGFNLVYNNYKGFGVELHRDQAHSLALSQTIGPFSVSGGVGAGIGDDISSLDGGTFSHSSSKGYGESVTFSIMGVGLSYATSRNVGVGTNINTRTGEAYKTYNGTTTKGYSLSYSKSSTTSSGQSVGTGGSFGFSNGSTQSITIPVSSISYSPKSANDFSSTSSSFSMKAGSYSCAGLQYGPWGISHELGIYTGLNAYSNTTDISDKFRSRAAYGYFNLENADENSILDFNRNNESPILKESPSLPMAFHTYDIFSASAQGMYASFRPHRSDVGTVYDNVGKMTGSSSGLGLEMGVGLFMHLGINKYKSTTIGRNGKLSSSIDQYHNYYAPDITNVPTNYYEKYYLKNFGELTASDAAFDNKIGNTSLISPNVYKTSEVSFDFSSPIAGNASSIGSGNAIYKTKRDFRNTNYRMLDARQASQYGLQRSLRDYPVNTLALDNYRKEVTGYASVSRLAYGRDNHMSEVSVVNADGRRYVYGDPDYNFMKQATVFNASEKNIHGSVAGLGFNGDRSLVNYDGTTFSMANNRGLDNLFKQEKTPAYAQSLLLSSILSDDYVDMTGNGPSYDDLGDYTKFNYSTVNHNYGWRTPYNEAIPGAQEAIYDKGLIADEFDDKGIVDYGQKELKYLHSIETKNYVALFKISKRKDALGVTSIHGGFPTQTGDDQRMYRLDRIELYAKNELMRAAAAGTAPVPLKTVNFEYTYDLCKGVPNNQEVIYHTNSADRGKLTLKRIWFTYGSSDKGSLAPYQFFYGDTDHDKITDANPNYDMKAVDKWGNYKQNSGTETGNAGVLNNDEFPYAEGIKSIADQNIASWNLSTIVSPTGAETDVDYETDDYGYVQNEPVGQMIKIVDVTDGSIFSLPPPFASSITFKNRIVVDLMGFGASGIKTTDPANSTDLYKRLFNNNDNIYFKCYTKLNKFIEPGLSKHYWDFVPGYAKVDPSKTLIYEPTSTYTIGSDTYYKYAVITLNKVGAEDNNTGTQINPITKAGWQFTRKYLPRIAYPGSEPSTTNPGNPLAMLVDIVAGLGTSVTDMVAGIINRPNVRFLQKLYCDEIDLGKSFVRLYNPAKIRLGGGHRVKQILMSDEWGTMATDNTNSANNEKTAVYGQKYEYTTVEPVGGKKISSGVAQYEPLAGGDEISLRQPHFFEVNYSMAPDDNLFQEEPYGESLYPSPLVGYSEVTITSIGKLKNSGAAGCGIGKTVYEYYTAKDFPVRTSTTGKSQIPIEQDPIDGFTVLASVTRMYGAAQGYVIELNDMHGKPRSVKTYAEGSSAGLVSSVTYSYKQSGNSASGYKLENTVPTVDETNVVQQEVIGRSIDLATDVRSTKSLNISVGQSKSVNISPCSLGFPDVSTDVFIGTELLGYACASMTKVVQTHGILYKTETTTNNLRASSENLLWDRKTGDVVLTKDLNNFDAPVYSFHYPAHWIYTGMAGQYRREGFTLKIPANNTTVYNYTSGLLTTSAISPFLEEGDEVAFYDGNNSLTIRAWVYYLPGQLKYFLIDNTGRVLNTANYAAIDHTKDYYVKVIRPDEKNELNLSAGELTSLNNPATGSSLVLNSAVIASSATEWCKYWNIYSDKTYETSTKLDNQCNTAVVTGSKYINPVTSGFSSKWEVLKSYAFRTPRQYAPQNNIASDGTYLNYSPFWDFSSGTWSKNTSGAYYQSWIPMQANTMVSPHGNLMESKNAIGVFNARDFSFNQTLLNTESSSAKYNQMGYESFEPYGVTSPFLSSCDVQSSDHLDFYKNIDLAYNPTSGKPYLDLTNAHTGRTSLRFNNGMTVTLNHFGPNDASVDNVFYDVINKNQLFAQRCGDTYEGPNNLSGNSIQIGKLHLDNGYYVLSFWLKGPATLTDFSALYSLNVVVGGTPLAPVTVDKTSIINGWQKFDLVYKINSSPYTPVNIAFKATLPGGVSSVNLDDVRIHPYHSNMVSYAYDPYSLRLWATLDDRNFASIVEYDNEGHAVRTKKETDKGLFTVMESRQSVVKP